MRLFSRREARSFQPPLRRLCLAAAACAAPLLAALPAQAADGAVALLIGNGAYENTLPLPTPSKDVDALEALLVDIGFDVTVVKDATSTEMRSALRDFGQQARDAEKALFYYSGHGLEIDGENYLIPTDAVLLRETDARREAVELNAVIVNASRASDLSVVIVDAARRNEFPVFRRIDPRGFKPAQPQARQVVAFSTEPGVMAPDVDAEFSPYAWALAEALTQRPWANVRELFNGLDTRTNQYIADNTATEGAPGAPPPMQMPTARFGDLSESSGRLIKEPEEPSEAVGLEPFRRFRDCEVCPVMIAIPDGVFTIGSPPDEPGRQNNEGPQRQVSIQQFAMGAAEITREQFAAFVKATKYDPGAFCRTEIVGEFATRPGRSWRSPEFPQNKYEPVVCVSWEDAQAYVKWLNQLAPNANYRLPSEAEWEYAARAGADTPFNVGERLTDKQANFNASQPFNDSPAGRFRRRTINVGMFEPNGWGLYDTHGNVWEWTQDCWNVGYAPEVDNGAARTRGDCNGAPIRGGSWYDTANVLRSANRARLDRQHRSNDVGFRVARDLN